jgi:2-methylcitrate dehydratase PrpD
MALGKGARKMTRRNLMQSTAAAAVAGQLVGQTPTPAGQDRRQVPPVTREAAEFIIKLQFTAIPEDVLSLAKKSILDGLGLALCGSAAASGKLTRDYLSSQSLCGGAATVIGSSIKTPPRFAAFANGVSIHADDYDDTQLAVAEDRVYGLLTHPTATALSAALATAESRGGSGRDLVTAYLAGVEVECKIAEAISPRHYEDGFHSTGTCGAIGAAAAAAKIANLNLETTLRTLGIAASQAAGLRENFGTMTKPFHAGRAAESGVLAADLAALGWTATDQILEAPRGFFHAAGGGFNPDAIHNKLASPWTFRSPGVSIKPYPSGSLTHPGMTEMARLIREHAIRPELVDRVDVGTNRNMPNALIHHQPKTGLQAKFSMEFCMAVLLLYGKAGLSEFTDAVPNRPEVRDMIARVHFGVHPVAEAAGYNKMTTILDIYLKDGRTISGRADFGKGSPANPMTFDEVAAKFHDCAAFAKWSRDKADQVVALVSKLEEVADVRRLTKCLA